MMLYYNLYNNIIYVDNIIEMYYNSYIESTNYYENAVTTVCYVPCL